MYSILFFIFFFTVGVGSTFGHTGDVTAVLKSVKVPVASIGIVVIIIKSQKEEKGRAYTKSRFFRLLNISTSILRISISSKCLEWDNSFTS